MIYYRILATIIVTGVSFIFVENLNHKGISYSPVIHVTIAPVDTYYQTSHYCSFQVSEMRMYGDDFSLSVASIAPSTTMKASTRK